MPSLTLRSFASGSSGNCTYIASDTTRLLIDAGISTGRIRAHLREMGTDLEGLHGICITHEHIDHVQALPVLQRQHPVPLFANAGTVQSIARSAKFQDLRWNIFTTGNAFDIGDFRIEPYSIPHDAFDPVGYLVHWGPVKIGMATDIGLPTALIRTRLKGCHAMVLETNHDEQMLQNADRPWSLKQRILGRQGHLSNDNAARMLVEIAGPQLQRVYLAHLSDDCNRPELARGTILRALREANLGHIEVELTHPNQASAPWRIEVPDDAFLQATHTLPSPILP